MTKKTFMKYSIWYDLSVSLFAIVVALVIGAIVIAVMGENPVKVYQSLLAGALGSPRDIANTVSKTIPLIFTGLAVAVGFRSGVFNIGAEGQLTFAAMVSVIVALAMPNMSPFIALPIIFISGILAGALIGAISGVFKAVFQINEVIVAIMLNYIVKHFTSFLANGPLKAPGTVAQTEMIAESFQLPKLLPRTQLTSALFIALIVVAAIYILLWKTSIGYKIRAVGSNKSAAQAAGINSKATMIFAMALSGSIASLAGITEVLGKQYRFIEGFSPSFGFTGIAVAVLGKNNPLGVILSAFLFGIMDNGALRMSRETAVSSSIIVVIQGLVILFISAPKIISFVSKRKEMIKK
ncbi:ABC transporter permease [Granulicatella sp. zg-ZJ]|uniref:ABC transporter permease n=1 Tax=unclassified Granulicatella TaxID=2630493 RepID=UPI0013BF4904|nr:MULTISPECIES: ABC transporter permease [unclassified Granulicatella]MBS4751091.1 ABC transporter permease [Carnobacteriaceae bacterium zg-ZUI78]NEW62912.1 ABC transporter permease [Granulicatella sp. zg-ZJ]NEW65835.1 ABC transporter permease [Granulicatella sp. zg-84]QMI86372.1 ABC transporter permease [Carnobacteriaceae bacterium zg-84]